MTTNDDKDSSWLPNLVGGVSIWKLAPDLNEEQFFDGRLLVPETEGSDSLPARVEWDLTGLVPLPEARAEHAEAVEKATADFFACLERTAEVFEKGGSGYDKYKEAFTVPALGADEGAHYFFDPADGKLKVINWGASPRKIKHAAEYLFGYQDFRDLIRQEQEAAAGRGDAPPARAGAKGAAAAMIVGGEDDAGGADAEGAASEGEAKDEEKKDEEEEVTEGRPWWVWVLVVVGLLFLAWLGLVLFQQCQQPAIGPDGGVAAGEDAGLAEEPIYGTATDDGGPPATDMGDGGVVADGSLLDGDGSAGGEVADGSTAGDGDGGGSGDGSGSGSGDGSGDGSGSGSGDGSGSGSGDGSGSGSGNIETAPPTDSSGDPIYGESSDSSGGYYYWLPGYGQPLPSRAYYHADAVQWRIIGGTAKVRDYSGSGAHFRVYLRPGENFDGVRVQWRDPAGNWHDH